MKDYNDPLLKGLIIEGKEATHELNNLKQKKQKPQIKKLLVFRRAQLNLIRIRATELNLTETDFESIRQYVQED